MTIQRETNDNSQAESFSFYIAYITCFVMVTKNWSMFMSEIWFLPHIVCIIVGLNSMRTELAFPNLFFKILLKLQFVS